MTSKIISETFSAWAKDERADEMAEEHWPSVRQAFELIPDQEGDYLEIGVGSGYGVRHMATHQFSDGQCLGLDLSGEMVEVAQRRCADLANVEIEQGDFLTRDFGDRRDFSIIFSMEVFYYFPDIQKGLEKAYSLLRPGGQLWVLVDYYKENSATHDWPERYQMPIQLWSTRDYFTGFIRAGFSEVEQQSLLDPKAERTGSSGPGTLCTSGMVPRS